MHLRTGKRSNLRIKKEFPKIRNVSRLTLVGRKIVNTGIPDLQECFVLESLPEVIYPVVNSF